MLLFVFLGWVYSVVQPLLIRSVSGAGRCEPQRSTEVGAVGSSDLPRPSDFEGNDGIGPDPPGSSKFGACYHGVRVDNQSDPEEPTLRRVKRVGNGKAGYRGDTEDHS